MCPSTFKVAFGERVVLVQKVFSKPFSKLAATKPAMHSFTKSSRSFLLDAKKTNVVSVSNAREVDVVRFPTDVSVNVALGPPFVEFRGASALVPFFCSSAVVSKECWMWSEAFLRSSCARNRRVFHSFASSLALSKKNTSYEASVLRRKPVWNELNCVSLSRRPGRNRTEF